MKRKYILTALLLILAAGAVLFAVIQNRTCFDGSRTADSDSYTLDIERMTGHDRHTLALAAGDVLGIQFETTKGSLYLEIKAPDDTVLYVGNGKAATEFTLNIPKPAFTPSLWMPGAPGEAFTSGQRTLRRDAARAPRLTFGAAAL